jgi:hypothetical protein
VWLRWAAVLWDLTWTVQDLSEVLYWLSNQAVVHWLAPRPRLYFSNVAASKIIQVGPPDR